MGTNRPSPSPLLEAMPETVHHSDLMDGVYRNQRHVYDLTRKYYLLGRDRLLKDLRVEGDDTVLEIACGTGRNLGKARRLYPDTQMFGLDISAEMLKSARLTLAKDLVANRVQLAQGDACAFDPHTLFGRPSFDRIFISYGLSMIPDWEGALEQAVDVLAPGGSLHVVDFGQQAGLPVWFKDGLHTWLSKFHVTPRAPLEQALKTVAQRCNGVATLTPVYRDYAWLGTVRSGRTATV